MNSIYKTICLAFLLTSTSISAQETAEQPSTRLRHSLMASIYEETIPALSYDIRLVTPRKNVDMAFMLSLGGRQNIGSVFTYGSYLDSVIQKAPVVEDIYQGEIKTLWLFGRKNFTFDTGISLFFRSSTRNTYQTNYNQTPWTVTDTGIKTFNNLFVNVPIGVRYQPQNKHFFASAYTTLGLDVLDLKDVASYRLIAQLSVGYTFQK